MLASSPSFTPSIWSKSSFKYRPSKALAVYSSAFQPNYSAVYRYRKVCVEKQNRPFRRKVYYGRG